MRIDHRRSLTLLEVIIAAALVAACLGFALGVFASYSEAVKEEVTVSDLEMRVNRLERFLRTELQSAQAQSLTLSDPLGLGFFTRLDYRVVTGYDAGAGAVILSEPRRLDFEFDAGETADNTSQDGDRYIDEGRLVLSIDRDNDGSFGAGERVVIAEFVASSGEEYIAGAGAVGGAPVFALPSGAAGAVSTDTNLSVSVTLLAPNTRNSQGVSLRTVALSFALRNP